MRFLVIFFLLLIALYSADAQIIDRGPSDRRNQRAAEGGGQKVKIDSITPLPQLLNRLLGDWKYVDTWKSYWIGYTDDMYSIAGHGDSAIIPLTKLIDTIGSLKGKKGALCTLHLIGINATIKGRFYEEFTNKNARNAILKYLNDTSLHELVVSLLMRDPWLSDVPALMTYLELPDKDYSKVLSALRRYNIIKRPLGQEITDTIFYRTIEIRTPGEQGVDEWVVMNAFQNEYKDLFVVDDEITGSAEWKQSKKQLAVSRGIAQSVSVAFDIYSDKEFSYCDFRSTYFYAFKDHIVTVCGPRKTREIWLEWWTGISQKQKDDLTTTDHVSIE